MQLQGNFVSETTDDKNKLKTRPQASAVKISPKALNRMFNL